MRDHTWQLLLLLLASAACARAQGGAAQTRMNGPVQVIACSEQAGNETLYHYQVKATVPVQKVVLGYATALRFPGLPAEPIGTTPQMEIPAGNYSVPYGWMMHSGPRRGNVRTFWVEVARDLRVNGAKLFPGLQNQSFSIRVARSDLSFLVGIYSYSLDGMNLDFSFLQPCEADFHQLIGSPGNLAAGGDVTRWKEYKDPNGWSVRLPNSWSIPKPDEDVPTNAPEDIAPDDSGPSISGPPGCGQKSNPCAYFDVQWEQVTPNDPSSAAPCDYLRAKINEPPVIHRAELTVAGMPACEVYYFPMTNYELTKSLQRTVAVRLGDRMFTINYSETAMDQPEVGSGIASWKHGAHFDKMLATFSYVPPEPASRN